MTFFVYENWTRDRGRIHRGECPVCNEGRGVRLTDSGKNGRWHGPFTDRDDAFKKAAALKRTDMQPCQRCKP